MDYQTVTFPYRRCADQDAAVPVRHPVVVVGAGPVGLSLAIDLAQRGQRVLLLDNDHRLSAGSRAICFAKRTLEIFDRLGVGQRLVDKGVSWNVGRVFFKDQPVYQFDLLPEPGHERPAFISIDKGYSAPRISVAVTFIVRSPSSSETESTPSRMKIEGCAELIATACFGRPRPKSMLQCLMLRSL